MRCRALLVFTLATLAVVEPAAAQTEYTPPGTRSLLAARKDFVTKPLRQKKDGEAAPAPPSKLFLQVKYPSPAGEMAAYLSPRPADGKKRPAIIWLFGGFSNGIGETAWEKFPPKNDQSASAFRQAGIVMMYPSLRGGNTNPGSIESFYGEVNDVLAAADYLAKLDYVDPTRIYLGGHSTGGTLALLVAESTARFRAVFAFGPAADVGEYGPENLNFDAKNPRERELRAPMIFLWSIQNPTFVFEGNEAPSNLEALEELAKAARNPRVHFFPVPRASHFSVLAPVTRLVAAKILRDDGSSPGIAFTPQDLSDAMK